MVVPGNRSHEAVGPGALRRPGGQGGNMILCKKLGELPPVVAEGQQALWCPDCEHYDGGMCDNPARTGPDGPCPLDCQALPLRRFGTTSMSAITDLLFARRAHPPSHRGRLSLGRP